MSDQNFTRDPDTGSGSIVRWLCVPVVATTVVAGVWITGGFLTNDEVLAKAMTLGWFIVTGMLCLWVAWRYRRMALPVLGTYVVVAGILGGYLLYTSSVDRVVNEDVVTVGPQPAGGDGVASAEPSGQPSEPEPSNVKVASGEFVNGEHSTTGAATLIDTADGRRVLTLTKFATDPGPDLRVVVVPKGASNVDGGVDLGALKGNKGDQQYAVPDGAPRGQVVIWCRAFSVVFGSAVLA